MRGYAAAGDVTARQSSPAHVPGGASGRSRRASRAVEAGAVVFRFDDPVAKVLQQGLELAQSTRVAQATAAEAVASRQNELELRRVCLDEQLAADQARAEKLRETNRTFAMLIKLRGRQPAPAVDHLFEGLLSSGMLGGAASTSAAAGGVSGPASTGPTEELPAAMSKTWGGATTAQLTAVGGRVTTAVYTDGVTSTAAAHTDAGVATTPLFTNGRGANAAASIGGGQGATAVAPPGGAWRATAAARAGGGVAPTAAGVTSGGDVVTAAASVDGGGSTANNASVRGGGQP